MKSLYSNKFLGLALGERSLLAAELSTGRPPQIRRLAEFVYPDGVSLAQPEALGQALRRFLAENAFTARRAVVGLPAKWLLVRPKSVPATDAATTRQMLRLQAETEFSSELNDLIYDYIQADPRPEAGSSGVLLVATRKAMIAAIGVMCLSARLTPAAIMPQAAALDAATSTDDAWVIQSHADGAELSARAGATGMIRHLRASVDQPAFAGEFLRAVASINGGDAPRQVLIWSDQPADRESLEQRIGMPVRAGDLPQLGAEMHLNGTMPAGQGPHDFNRFAAAVALGLSGQAEEDRINFLRSRLAPPKVRRIPPWSVLAAAAVLLLIVGGVVAWNQLQTQQARLQTLQSNLDGMNDRIQTAEAFVNKVAFARHWHADEPRYLLCLRDLTLAIPADGATYATSLILRDPAAGAASSARPDETRATANTLILNGQLYGKTTNQQSVQNLLERLKHAAGFTDVKLGGTQNATRGEEVSFSINFVYHPAAAKAAATPSESADARSTP